MASCIHMSFLLRHLDVKTNQTKYTLVGYIELSRLCSYLVMYHFKRTNAKLPTQAEDMSPANTVYFDGSCPICRREIAVYQRKADEHAIQWVDVSLKESETLIPVGLSRAVLTKRFNVRQSSGQVVSSLAAFMVVWQCTPGFRWFARLAALRSISALLSILYEIFLKIRELKKHPILGP
jgi:predicted DCC family thiol-disulfide oxidoreductase YuxK